MSYVFIATYFTLILLAFTGIIIGSTFKRFSLFFLGMILLSRLVLILLFETGLKYYFVLDSLKYEQDGWNLAKSWIIGYRDLIANLGQTNLYTYINGLAFYIFGYEPRVLLLFNAIIGTLTTWILYLIARQHIEPHFNSDHTASRNLGKIYMVLIGLYPSLIVWTTTNTKDPVCILLSSLLVFSILEFRKSLQPMYFGQTLTFLLFSLLLLFLIYELRAYETVLFAFSILCSLFFMFFKFCFGLKRTIFTLFVLSILSSMVMHEFAKETQSFILNELIQRRLSFTNLNLVDVAKSSFLIDVHLDSFFDLFWFVPSTLAYYFFGPFPWEIQNRVQMAGLFETTMIWILAIPTFHGVRTLYKKSENLTLFLITIVFVHALAQSAVISNMGTIFRHRSFSFCILAIFTTLGLYEIWKKNFQNLLSA